MAGQSLQRREILRILSIASTAAAFPGFSKWCFACAHPQQDLHKIRPSVYQPIFFTPAEYALIERLTDIIIPNDGTPGALEAGVAEFIDLMSSRDAELQHSLRSGLLWLDAHSKSAHGKAFLALSAHQQTDILVPLAYKANFRRGQQRGREFFATIREYTVMGFYTSETGLRELDFPGLKFYAESPACPHTNDPENLHLPPPKW
jgi:gluconate 2-dehydrogenase gamma chain